MIWSVSATIGIDWSILEIFRGRSASSLAQKETVSDDEARIRLATLGSHGPTAEFPADDGPVPW